jgi:SAM-dependent methyltransferase
MDAQNPKDVVRRGYDAVSVLYDEWSGGELKYSGWLAELAERISAGASVLDLGCGSGLPVARDLTTAGCHVTGVDISAVQIQRAKDLVPAADFVQADICSVDFASESFDAVVSFFALIHLPLEEQPPLLRKIADWLRPGGVFVATTGYSAWTGYEDNWLDGGAPMWWSHADVATYRSWIAQAGLVIEREEFVPEGDGGHALFLTSRPKRPAQPRTDSARQSAAGIRSKPCPVE